MLTVYLSEANKPKFDIPAGQTTVGRALSNNIVIDIPKVSRKHAYFENDGKNVFIADLGSSNGTFVNKSRLLDNQKKILKDQDVINFGELDANFTIDIYQPTLVGVPKGVNDSQDTVHDNAFGFKPNEINFSEEGVGREAATKLAERFRKLLPKPISSGGMGKILLVQEIMSSRVVALKVMLEIALDREPLVQQFVREAVITARLQHPNIIPVYDIGFLGGNQLYYTMRYIEGQAFNQLIYKVELEERLRILRSAALAVDHAHSKGLWHRDLKPPNILVGKLGDPYVIDWGLVSIQADHDYKLDLPRIVVDRAPHIVPDRLLKDTEVADTVLGFGNRSSASSNSRDPSRPPLLGTPAYMAPEQFTGPHRVMGKVSDVWAFGVMLFQALTGQHPIRNYRSLDVYEMLEHVASQDLPQPRQYAPNTPQKLNDLCQRMLIRDPARRMPDLSFFIDEITHYLKGQGATLFSFGVLEAAAIDPQVARDQRNLVNRLQQENARLKKELKKRNSSQGVQVQDHKLQEENAYLKKELERFKRRNKILFEMSQLGLFSGTRKKELQRQLIDI